MLCQAQGAALKVISISDIGEPLLPTFGNYFWKLLLEKYGKLLTRKTKIVSISYVSNTLGTINPIEEIIQKAPAKGAVVVVYGAQAMSHLPINVH